MVKEVLFFCNFSIVRSSFTYFKISVGKFYEKNQLRFSDRPYLESTTFSN